MKETGALKKLFLILILVVLLPALFYSGYEISTMSATEEMIGAIYSQQLDVILFSLNQYALDVANNWASSLNILINENRNSTQDSLAKVVERFLAKNSAISSLIVTDTSLEMHRYYSISATSQQSVISESSIVSVLNLNEEIIHRLIRYQRINYRKIEPIQIGEREQSALALVFVAGDEKGNQSVATLVLNEQSFVRDVLSTKLREAAGEEFILVVGTNNSPGPIFATSPISAGDVKQKKALWLFPNHYLGINLKGATVEELSQSRFTRNLLLIILLDVVLIIGVWIVFRNIRRQVEFVRLKTDFVSNVSHELRTPLSLIRMYAETLDMQRIKNEEKKKEYYSTILQETERLTRLVNNILDFSKMEAGKKVYNIQDADLNQIVSDLLESYKSHLQNEGFSPIIELFSELPPFQADKEALTEAIMNVLENAIKYSNAEKYLRLATGREGNSIFVEIEDHGIGIASEHHKKIYENFYRVSSGLVHNVKGSGLGLALVKHIVDSHHGTITLKSAPGKGSLFRLKFPLNAKK